MYKLLGALFLGLLLTIDDVPMSMCVGKNNAKEKDSPFAHLGVMWDMFVGGALSPFGLGTVANAAQSCHLLL